MLGRRVLLLLVSWWSLCCWSIDAEPSSFVWGTSSSSYQYEGHISADGKQPSIWDEYCLQGQHCKGENANTADNQYDLEQLDDDVNLMKDLGTSAYRLSFAWPRIMTSSGNVTSKFNARMTYPTNKVEQRVNTAGVTHYARVLDVLRKRDITPLVTLWHWDTPLWIEELGGWLNDDMPAYFAEYAEAVFRAYGQSEIKNWLTLNEPHTVATAGYMYGVGAPGRCSDRSVCAQGNSSTEPYIVAHNMLRAHARTVSIFRQLQTVGVVRGDARISMAISADWTEPWDATCEADIAAAERRQAFQVGWFAEPLRSGDYPPIMRKLVGDRLPVFSQQDATMLKNSWDYFALNHYTSRYGREEDVEVREQQGCKTLESRHETLKKVNKQPTEATWDTDQRMDDLTYDIAGNLIGWPAQSDWLYAVPWGMHKLLVWLSKTYASANSDIGQKSLSIWITENGVDIADKGADQQQLQRTNNMQQEVEEDEDAGLVDDKRILYFDTYLDAVQKAREEGVDVRAYFAWSLLDNFEWGDGYTANFGFYRVDMVQQLRQARKSAAFFRKRVDAWPF